MGGGPPTEASLNGHPNPVDNLKPLDMTADPAQVDDAHPAPNPEPAYQTAPASEPIAETPPSQPIAVPAQPVVVPGQYNYLKRWMFVLMLAAVWIPAALTGLALYYYWYHSIDKTLPVFLVLVCTIVCTVGGLLLAMVQHKPVVSALAIAVMTAPFAALAGAAVVHGLYYCERVGHCLVGLIPY